MQDFSFYTMLIRNLRTASDYRKQVLKQDEQLKLAIANDSNIASARKSIRDGEVPTQTAEQQRSKEEIITDTATTEALSRDNLLSVFSLETTTGILSKLDESSERFLNIYWKDIKKELESKTNPRLITPSEFVELFKRYTGDVMAQNGMATETNGIEKLRALLPNKGIAMTVLKRNAGLVSAGDLQQLKNFISVLPDEEVYTLLEGLSDYNRERYIKGLVNLFKLVKPVEEWRKVTELPKDEYLATQRKLGYDLTPKQIQFAEQMYEQMRRDQAPASASASASASAPAPGYIPLDRALKLSRSDQDKYLQEIKSRTGVVFFKPEGISALLKKAKGAPMRNRFFTERDADIQDVFKVTRGSGMVQKAIEPTPVWTELGKFKINNRALEQQMLSVRYASGACVPFQPVMRPISNSFQELLQTLFETKKVDKRILKEMDTDERQLAETIFVKSGIGKQVGINEVTPTDEEATKLARFNILKGSYNAGNSSKEVIEEMRGLILHFISTQRISRKDGLRTLETLH
jgi:hypothetical protein